MLLLVVAIILTILGMWSWQSASSAATARLPSHVRDMHGGRFSVDPYLWSGLAPPGLRRRYILGQVATAGAFVLWGLIAHPYEPALSFALISLAILGALVLLVRCIRHAL